MTTAGSRSAVGRPGGSSRQRLLLTIGHSYVVGLNRRLAHEMSRVGGDRWAVTAAAPTAFHGDLRPISLEAIHGEASELVPLPVHASRNLHLFFYGRGLAALLRRRRWDLVHVWQEPYGVAAAEIAALAPRDMPLVYFTAQNIDKRYPRAFRRLERFVIDRSAAWIAVGLTTARTHSERPGYRDRPMAVIPLGVDLDVFAPSASAGAEVRAALGWPSDGVPVVGFVGRFVPAKGLSLLMSALDDIEAPWRALFVGGGPWERRLRQWARRHPDRVRVVTSVPHDAVPGYINAMDLLCAPSQTTAQWREQLGRMLVEGFACGVPVIGSDSGEIPYVLGDAGVVVGENDRAGWVAAIDALVRDPERRAELATRGRERAVNDFSWPVIARRTLDFFEEVLSTHRTRR
jgi:glycosyltransferase involved in cell wall biosynthesis